MAGHLLRHRLLGLLARLFGSGACLFGLTGQVDRILA